MRFWMASGSSFNLIVPTNYRMSGTTFFLRLRPPLRSFAHKASICFLVIPRLKTMSMGS